MLRADRFNYRLAPGKLLSNDTWISLLYAVHSMPLSQTIAFALDWLRPRLGEKADLSEVFIGRIERGVESPPLDNIVKIARALGVRVRDLVEGF